MASLTLDGGKIDDLYLDFTLPSEREYELKPNGQQLNVTIDNLEEYTSLLVRHYLRDGVMEQMDSFKRGLNSGMTCSTLSHEL